MLHHDIAHLHLSTNVPTQYQISTPVYEIQDFKGQCHYGKVIGQIKITPSHCTPTPQNVPTKYRPYGF